MVCLSFAQDDIVKEFREEIRKLKTMIVKHENRIRALEARPVASDETGGDNDKTRKDAVENHSSGDSLTNQSADVNANSSGDREELAPDEV